MTIGAMGSGSDYSPFIQHLGIPALNVGFGGEDDGGEYHSIYDSYDHYKRFKGIESLSTESTGEDCRPRYVAPCQCQYFTV
ncbi:MAG: hypothetical protein U5K54_21330 [Cytophagales bacterium]|nr:hypothetical protein [Cytophagales bacterium]